MAFLNHCSWKGKAADCLLPLRGTCFTKLPLALCSEGPGVPGAVSGTDMGCLTKSLSFRLPERKRLSHRIHSPAPLC